VNTVQINYHVSKYLKVSFRIYILNFKYQRKNKKDLCFCNNQNIEINYATKAIV